MNCKPGDLAYITHPQMLGKLVTVLRLAPSGFFRLPDGTQAVGQTRGDDWVIESMGEPFAVRGTLRDGHNTYAVCSG